MVGMFSRGFARCSKGGAHFASLRGRVSSSAKINTSLQRSFHGSKHKRTAPASIMALNSRISLLQTRIDQMSSPCMAGSLLVNVQAAGISSVSSEGGPALTGTSTSESGVELSENVVDPLREATMETGPPVVSNQVLSAESLSESLSEASTPIIQQIPDGVEDIFASTVHTIGTEVPLTALGLGGYTPVGLIQNCLDFLHLNVGLPWWGAIVCGTFVFRLLVFPVMVKGQVNTARLNAVKPELERLQAKMKDASNYQNPMFKAQAAMEMQKLFQDNKCHPVKSLMSPLIQMPLFISFFLALRNMANLPVESMKTGGTLWFPDLVAADPYIALPIIASATMLLAMETGGDMAGGNEQAKTMKNVFRGLCVVMVPLTYKFPTAVFMYWVTSNFLSLVQVGVLKIPQVKTYFEIPEPIPVVKPIKESGGFIENFKAGFKSSQELAMVKNQEKMKQKQYEQSLKNPHKETFDINPRVKENERIFKTAASKKKQKKRR